MRSQRRARAIALAVVSAVALLAAVPAGAQPARIATTVASAPAVRVDAFDVEQVAALGPGTPLTFSLYGTPGGQATLHIEGAASPLAMVEAQAGVYEATHVVARGERIGPQSRVRAELVVDGRMLQALLDEPLVLGAPPVATTGGDAACTDCAVVETIRTVNEPGSPGVVGAMAGGVVGALVGRQVGRGDGRTAGSILGAVGGAVVGREIERRVSQRTRYEVAIRGADGVVETRRYDTPPPFRVGDRLRAGGGAWRPEPQP